nr:hypothetical protein [Tanacetum cinerariifolium]
MITDEMKLMENYKMYDVVFRVDVPTTQSQPIESSYGMHKTTRAPKSPNLDVVEGESSDQHKSIVIRLRIPSRRSTRLTLRTLVPTIAEVKHMTLQGTIQLSIIEQKSHDDFEARQNVEKVNEHLVAEETEKIVEGTKNVEEDVVDNSNLNSQNDPNTRLEPRSYKENPEVEKIAIVLQHVNVIEEEDESAEDDYEFRRREKGKEKTSEHGIFVFGESSSGQVNESEPDDDEFPTEKVSLELVEEMLQTVDEAKLRKVVDEIKDVLSLPFLQKPTPVAQSCQRDPKPPTLPLVNQDMLYLKKGNLGPEKIMLSLYKFPAKNPHAKIFYIKRQKEPRKPKEEVYSNLKIVQVIKTYRELGHEHKLIAEIIARRENGSIVLITKPDYKNLNMNDIEDMYLLCINIKVGDYAKTGLLWSLSVFIGSLVIWERVHDFQLGMESYQQKVNLTAPTIIFPGIKKYKMFSIVSELVYIRRVLEGLKRNNNDVKRSYMRCCDMMLIEDHLDQEGNAQNNRPLGGDWGSRAGDSVITHVVGVPIVLGNDVDVLSDIGVNKMNDGTSVVLTIVSFSSTASSSIPTTTMTDPTTKSGLLLRVHMANLQKLDANVPNDADYDAWLPLASVHKEPLYCRVCLIFGHSLDDCPKAPKQVVNRIDNGKGGSFRADDEGFIKVKKKKSGGNNGRSKNVKPVLVKKTHYRPKENNSFEALNVANSVIKEVETSNMASTSSARGRGSKDKGEFADNKMTSYLALKPMGVGYDNKSLLEQWKETYVNVDYDPYDDDMYEGQVIPDNIQSICDNLDIKVRGRKKK